MEGSSRVRELKRDEVVFIVKATVVENHASGHLGGKLQAHIELGSLRIWSLLNSIFSQLFTVQEQSTIQSYLFQKGMVLVFGPGHSSMTAKLSLPMLKSIVIKVSSWANSKRNF